MQFETREADASACNEDLTRLAAEIEHTLRGGGFAPLPHEALRAHIQSGIIDMIELWHRPIGAQQRLLKLTTVQHAEREAS